MTKIGACQAKTQFAALLDRVEKGERIAITRHGRVVAVLAPPPGAPGRTAAEAIDALLELRRGRRLGRDVTIRELIDDGRS
jgi:prevent-host-death family protein